MDITATLRLIEDVTANPELIRLLTGPRWQVGPRDLALLGRRARELAHAACNPADDAHGELVSTAVLSSLERAVAEVDPTEVVSLLDALDSPGEMRTHLRPGIGSAGFRLSSPGYGGTPTSPYWT